MQPWYNVVKLRKEVREGRSFSPDEFAIHLEQIVAGQAPRDYLDPQQFFSRSVFTRALRDHCGMVLRRLSGETESTSPVVTLVTQFGGGKTHTLATLYHLATNGQAASAFDGVPELLEQCGLSEVPPARVAVLVGNAWDPQPGRETPWIDIARQLAGDEGVRLLGTAAKTTPPGTEALGRLFEAAGGAVLLLLDEVLNLVNRHRDFAEPFHAFIQNLTVATTGLTRGAAVISLPRSQVEMTDWDSEWQAKITKVVKRVATDLIANDEGEIGEVIRRRLFENIGKETVRRAVAKQFAEWCFHRRDRMPPEWMLADASANEKQASQLLRERFERCYPFHPATLSVFQRKWQALPQYQQTRGTLAMLAHWVSLSYREGYAEDKDEPLISLGLAPLHISSFRSTVLGQLGEPRLDGAIEADISGVHSHARALDADCSESLSGIHRRVGTAILFESSGGQSDKVAHLPELRFAVCKPGLDTTSVDNAAYALEDKGFFTRRMGSDGYQLGHEPTLKKVIADRRASLDFDTEVKPEMRRVIQKQFEDRRSLPIVFFPTDATTIPDTPRLTLVVLDPDTEWDPSPALREQLAAWTNSRNGSSRLYPGSLIWCLKKPGRDLRERVETCLAWNRVKTDSAEGLLGEGFTKERLDEVSTRLAEAREDMEVEVWASYRFVMLSDNGGPGGLRRHPLDLGVGHPSSNDSLSGRVLSALKSEGLLNESVGSAYIERNWPPALRSSGMWPLTSLRQCFLNGTLTRLPDTDRVLQQRIVEFVTRGELGLASGDEGGTLQRIWFGDAVGPEDVLFEPGVFLLTRERAQTLRGGKPAGDAAAGPDLVLQMQTAAKPAPAPARATQNEPGPQPETTTLTVSGTIPSEAWNRFGQKVVTKLRSSGDLTAEVSLTLTLTQDAAVVLEADVNDALTDLGFSDQVRVDRR